MKPGDGKRVERRGWAPRADDLGEHLADGRADLEAGAGKAEGVDQTGVGRLGR